LKQSKYAVFILVSGLILIIAVLGLYVYYFGTNFSSEHTTWAEFGSFFGGLLSPLIAFLAIIMLYQTLASQISEFKESVAHLSATAKIAAEDLELTRKQTQDNETLSVLANAETQISALLECVVSEQATQPEVTIFHMCLEGGRLSNPLNYSDSYVKFIDIAQQEGSVVWSYVYALHEIIESMVAILQEYSNRHSGQFSPTILYYHGRLASITKLLNDCNFITNEKREEIVKIVDMHNRKKA
jgi:uncharacterized membrane protein